VSSFRPSFSPQPQVYPRASSDSTFERLPSRTNLIGPLPRPDLNSRPLNRLRPLKVSCLSFCNLYPLFSVACSLFRGNTPGGIPLSQALGFRVATLPSEHAHLFSRRVCAPLSTFRINTCKSASKQTTLSPFRINTCEKPGEGVPSLSRHSSLATRHFPLGVPTRRFPFQSATSRLCSRAPE